jgi:tetratricopeptide (TPR) repeat protein
MDRHSLAKFLKLPVNPRETWQGGVVTLAKLLGIPPEQVPDQSGIVLWRCSLSEFLHSRPVLADADDAFDEFIETMLELSEMPDVASRPGQIESNNQRFAEKLNEYLQGSGTVVKYQVHMDDWNAEVRKATNHMRSVAPTRLPSLRAVGCGDKQIREFADAASEFYRAKLWELLDDNDLIQIEKPKPPRGMKYATVMGAGGQSYGLGFYPKDKDHYDLMAGNVDPRRLNLGSLIYESPDNVASDDVSLWQELGCPLETGEAFPDVNHFSPEGPRRPTPAEIDFLTIVLRALAQTTEDELDSGRWTKSVTVSGKVHTCVLSIPNLLDPPDRAEWMRRGKMPDARGHEIHFRQVQEFIDSFGQGMNIDELNAAINAKFTGRPLDDYKLPRNTPAERAEAIYQEALGSFGRRRVILAKQALAEDPNHVESGILVAEETREADRRIELFSRAKQAAATVLGANMKELAGEFWGFHETRPYMRACHGLAVAYAEAGQTSDAIEQYREMLRLNPNDNQGVRYEIVPLLLELNRDAEAVKLLDDYPEESAQWMYTVALVEFRRDGRSAKARSALKAAFKVNPYVPQLLQSDEPPRCPDSYTLGSPDEAEICLAELQKVMDDTEEFYTWLFEEYLSWERERAKQLRDQKRKSRTAKAKRKKRR